MSEQHYYQAPRGNWPQTLAILSLLALAGIALAIYQYHQHSRVILSAGNELTQRIHQQISNHLLATYEAPRQALVLLQHDVLMNTSMLAQRRPHLHKLASVLQHNPQLNSIYIGWPDGDYMMLRPLHSLTLRERFQAPEGSVWQLWHISHENGRREVIHEFYTADIRLLASGPVDDENYDPRKRIWYQQALQQDGVVITPPYVFFSTSEYGTTLALAGRQQQVIAADVTLHNLSATLQQARLTDTSEMVIYDQQGTVLAYHEPQRMLGTTQSGQQRLRRLDELGSTLLAAFAERDIYTEMIGSLVLEGRVWQVTRHRLQSERFPDAWLAVLVPQNELLAEAYRVRFESVLATLLITLLLLPVAWGISRMRG